MSDTARRLEEALKAWRTFGDTPASEDLAKILEEFVDERIVMRITKTPFIAADTLTDADYEAMLGWPGSSITWAQAPEREVIPIGQLPIGYGGKDRPTCAVCAALLVDGLCWRDAAHYQ